MKKLLSIAQNDLTVAFKEKGIWINLVIVPVVLIFIIGLVGGGFGDSAPSRSIIHVYDDDQSVLSTQLLTGIRDLAPYAVLCPMDNDEADVCGLGEETTLSLEASEQKLINGQIRAIIHIPQDFETALLRGEATTINYRSSENFAQPTAFRQAVQTAITHISGASIAGRVSAFAMTQNNAPDISEADTLAQTFYETATVFWRTPPITVNYRLAGTTGETSSTVSGFSQSVPGMGSMYVMFTVLAGTTALLLERKNWTLQRLVMMPLQRWQLLGGKILARFILGMIQYAVAFGFGAVLGVRLFDNFIGILALMIAFALCMTALAFILATLVKTDMQAASVTLLVTLTIAPLGGAWWPLELVPDFMKTIALFTPMGWAMHGYNQLIVYGGGLGDVVLPVLVLLGGAGVLFSLAIWRFRYE